MLHQIMAATARHDREEEEETAQNYFYFFCQKHIYNVHRAENYLLNVLTMCVVTQHEMSFALD